MKLKPKYSNVLIKKFPKEETIDGGQILLPELAQKLPMLGFIQELGPDQTQDLKVGDIAVFPRYSGINPKVKGKEFFLLPAKDILAVIEVS